MSDYSTKDIDNTIINKYLFYKNLDINRIYSSSKKKIKKIDHFIWWFTKQKFRNLNIHICFKIGKIHLI